METENQLVSQSAEAYQKSISLFKDGGSILIANEAIVSKIRQSGKSIINRIQANGGQLTPELDKLCNDYIAKVNQRLKEINEARAPITQMMTAVQKMFTGLEAQLDIKKPDTELAIIQSFRNEYARQVAEAEKKKREEADRIARKQQEAIQIKASAEQRLSEYLSNHLLQSKQSLQTRFNSIQIEDFDEKIQKLQSYMPAYSYEHFGGFQAQSGLYAALHTQEELAVIIQSVTTGKYEAFAEKFKSEMTELRDMLLARSESKKKELMALKEADDEERQRLAEIQKQREEDEKRKMKEQALADQKAADAAIAANAAAEEMSALFEKEVSVSVDTPSPETREGYEIDVTNNAGYMLIFSLWFEHEGKSLTADKMEKKTIGSMKKFCETLALKKDIKIDSKFITYKPIYKAVNRKSKD